MSKFSVRAMLNDIHNIYTQMLLSGEDVSNITDLKEKIRERYNSNPNHSDISPNRLTGTINLFIRQLGQHDRDSRKMIEESNSYRNIYLNVLSIYNKYRNKYIDTDDNMYKIIRDQIIAEYESDESLPRAACKHDLEYIVSTVMQFGLIGYSIMEKLDEAYGYKGTIKPNNAMQILKKRIV